MGLPAPVGYLYWYTTSIILFILTLLNVASKLYKHYSRPVITSPNAGSGQTPAPSSTQPEKSSVSSKSQRTAPRSRLYGQVRRTIRATGVWLDKHVLLTAITLPSVRFWAKKAKKVAYPTTEVAWRVGYTVGFLVLSFYGTGWDTLEWSNQAAWVAVAQVPLIIALAGKNNLISLLTGISYDRLNYLHRAAGNLLLLGSWIHAGGHWRLSHGWNDKAWRTTIVHWGFTSIFSITLLALLSLPVFRRKMFEFFLAMHIVLVALMLAAFVMHWRTIDVWIYPGVGLWAADRLLRVARLVVLNKLWIRPSLSPSAIHSTATLTLLTPSTLLVRFTQPSPHLKWSAGQHFYIVMPSISRLPWESHPFTASTIAKHPENGAEAGELAFIVRVRDGFTKKMKDTVDAARKEKGLGMEEKFEVEVKAAVDGPYGEKAHLRDYDGILIFAGGSGVSFALSHLLEVLREIREGKSRVKFISVVWMVTSRLHLDWITPLLKGHLHSLPPDLSLILHVHVTRHTFPRMSMTTLPQMPTGDFAAYLQDRANEPPAHQKRRRSRFMSTFSWASWTGPAARALIGGTRPGTRRGSMMPSESGKSDGSNSSTKTKKKAKKELKGNKKGRRGSTTAAVPEMDRRGSLAQSRQSESEDEKASSGGGSRRQSAAGFAWSDGYAGNTIPTGGSDSEPVRFQNPFGSYSMTGNAQVHVHGHGYHPPEGTMSKVVPIIEGEELEIVLNQPTPMEGVQSTAEMMDAPTVPSPGLHDDELDPHSPVFATPWRPYSPTQNGSPSSHAESSPPARIRQVSIADSQTSNPSAGLATPPTRVRQLSMSGDVGPGTPSTPPSRLRQLSMSGTGPNGERSSTPPSAYAGTPSPVARTRQISISDEPPRRHSTPLSLNPGAGRRGSIPMQHQPSPSMKPRGSILIPQPISMKGRPSFLDASTSLSHLAAPEMSRSSSTNSGSGASMASFTSTPSPIDPIQQLVESETISRPLTPSLNLQQLGEETKSTPDELRRSICALEAITDPKERRASFAAVLGPAELALRRKASEGLEGIVRWHEGRADLEGAIKELMENVKSSLELSGATSSEEVENGESVTIEPTSGDQEKGQGGSRATHRTRKGGKIMVGACGPKSLLDAAKKGAMEVMDAKEVWAGGVMVDYHAETFGW
ncbi:hypothetical protein CI109_103740 [Kwoniella shandongensis]|uniref:ferric-chelate reductase (NADPH) n=1 Tax=Kwoniella shandongensis TaxID=1734106 RepID=A0A5M6C7P3_9TREE|nr:uncharacterized protein CI109_000565 [Kwoniella shandongensis]KAA5530993.1 hypothetical protein CI109_000565 [Kwoniella shandongensis]